MNDLIYCPAVPEGFEWAFPVDPGDFEVFWTLSERQPGAAWEPIRMRLLKEDEHERPWLRAEMPWLGGHVLILRDEAIEAVGPLLAPYGELLPLVCDEARLVVFSARLVANALEEGRSDIVRFATGRIMDIRRHAFDLGAIAGTRAFKLAEFPRGGLFLTGDLVASIRRTGFTDGTEFHLIYDASAGERDTSAH